MFDTLRYLQRTTSINSLRKPLMVDSEAELRFAIDTATSTKCATCQAAEATHAKGLPQAQLDRLKHLPQVPVFL